MKCTYFLGRFGHNSNEILCNWSKQSVKISLNFRLGLDKQGNVKNFISIKEKITVRTMLGVRFFVLAVGRSNSYNFIFKYFGICFDR